MGKKKMQRATFDDMVRAKLQRENDKLKVEEFEIPSIQRSLLFKRPTDEMIFEFIEEVGKDERSAHMVELFAEIMYRCCEELQDAALHEELEITNPPEVVMTIMDSYDILMVGDEVCSMNKLYNSFDEEVKNS